MAAFLAYWLTYSVLERKAGQAGLGTTLLTLGATLGWLCSHHVLLAVERPALGFSLGLHGWEWLDPAVIVGLNAFAAPALILAALFCWRGAPGLSALADFLNQRTLP